MVDVALFQHQVVENNSNIEPDFEPHQISPTHSNPEPDSMSSSSSSISSVSSLSTDELLSSESIEQDVENNKNPDNILSVFQPASAITRLVDAIAEEMAGAVFQGDQLYAQLRATLKVDGYMSVRVPTISVKDYLLRMVQYAEFEPEILVLGVIYLNVYVSKIKAKVRALQQLPQYPDAWPVPFLHGFNIHRLLAVSMLTAKKFIDDTYFNNQFYSKVFGVSLSELNQLEINFLYDIDWSLFVTDESFHWYGQFFLLR